MERHEQYERVFTRFDSDGDGRICPAELWRCVGSMGGEMTAEEAEAAVELMDSDGDGLLCLDDFLRIVEGAGDEEKAGDLKAAFQMYVQEGGACITPKSLRRMLSRLGERKSVGECRNMIARFDLNGDGVLSFDEFRLMIHRDIAKVRQPSADELRRWLQHATSEDILHRRRQTSQFMVWRTQNNPLAMVTDLLAALNPTTPTGEHKIKIGMMPRPMKNLQFSTRRGGALAGKTGLRARAVQLRSKMLPKRNDPADDRRDAAIEALTRQNELLGRDMADLTAGMEDIREALQLLMRRDQTNRDGPDNRDGGCGGQRGGRGGRGHASFATPWRPFLVFSSTQPVVCQGWSR
ncbi:Calcium-binding protein CML38 [Striga hermonthica]|uniref:Calcium-binding protein CML38 n=1 Tax=Striga hermonthica TaxID=68872 RepID=A0A9N7RAT2_STRHE|nr:Calcium-binding protein CML38 [Striga hermonthica]